MPGQYPKDFHDRAHSPVMDLEENHETGWAAIQVIPSRLSVGAETVSKWMRRCEIDTRALLGVSGKIFARITTPSYQTFMGAAEAG